MTGREDVEKAIFQWVIGRNGERDRRIMEMYLIDGITYKEMMDRLNAEGYQIGIDGLKKVIRKRKQAVLKHL